MIKNVPSHWSKSVPLLTAAICLASTGVQSQDLLEEVVVTAQKREQNLQDVPVSVSAFTGAALTEAVIKDVFDLQTNVPGLTVGTSQSSTNTSFSIRGVGTSSQNFGLESSVGLYVDGAYRSRQNAMINNMVDIEAVEVLRGPQGTLFGKNTPSGAILFRTRAPSHETDGFLEVTAGNYGLVNVAGAASFSAIEDVLAFRVTGFSGQRDGFVSDTGFGDDVMNDRDRWGARLQALYTPNDDLTIRVIADVSEIDETCCAALTRISNLGLVSQDPRPGRTGTPGSDGLLAGLGGTIFSGDDYFDFETAVNDLPTSENEDRGLSVEVNWDVGDYTLTSLTSYRAFDSLDTIDSDFSDVDLFGTTNDAEQSSISQEFRLAYTGDSLNYVVGAYYFTQDLDLDYSLFTNSQFNAFYSAGLPAAALGLLENLDLFSAATGGLIAPSAEPAPADTRFDHVAEQEHQSWAIFGQLDYNLTDKLILTAGLRYTDEEKDLLTVFTETGPGGAEVPVVPDLLTTLGAAGVALAQLAAAPNPFDPALQGARDALVPLQTPGWGFNSIGVTTSPRPDVNPPTLNDEQVTGTLKLSYLANDDTMIYASYGTGYKSGGTNTDRIDAAFNPVFDAETSESFEVGIKTEFPDQGLRINAALHYTTIDDFQANSFTGNGFNLQNAGKIDSSGAEIEVYWVPSETVEVNFAYARIDAEFDSFERGTCWVGYPWHTGVSDPGSTALGDPPCDRSGDRVDGNSEDYIVLSGKKKFNFSNSISGYILGELTYSSEIILDGNQDPFKIQDDFERVNIRAGLRFEEYDVDLTLWGRNVFDEEVFGTTFDVPIQDGKLMAYPKEPRTYGLTLNKQF